MGPPPWWFITILVIVGEVFVLAAGGRLRIWFDRRKHRAMHLTVGLGSNDKYAIVKWAVPEGPTGDRIQVGKTSFVKLEGDFVFMANKRSDREFWGVPVSVYDRDTGVLVRAKHGEVEQMSEARSRASRLDNSLLKIKRGDYTDWAKIAAIVGVFAVLLLIVGGFMLVKILNGVSPD